MKRFLTALAFLSVLGALALGMSLLVRSVSREWFEKDIRLRAELAVRGARRAFLSGWDDPESVRRILDDITHDERILGTSACGADGRSIATTREFPPTGVECTRFVGRLGATGVHEFVSANDRDLFVSAVPVSSDAGPLGAVILVHDLSFVTRRERSTQRFYLFAFGVLAVFASLATYVISRARWRRLLEQLRNLTRGGERTPEFAPILSEVRHLVDRLAAEQDADGSRGWTPERLRTVLRRHLHGERILIVANREPYIHEKDAAGDIRVVHPASGLVTALEPVMRACSGVWIAHGSGSADRETSDAKGRVSVPPGENLYVTRRVWLTAEEEAGYYYGYSNEGLWPLCHVAHLRPTFRSSDFRHYAAINDRFAKAVAEEADGPDPIVLVQDYHFAMAPRLIRERLPRATVLTFWHIPWPSAERLGICPRRVELVEGLLGSSILGFHTQQHCNNFLDAVDRYLEARIDRERNAVIYRGHLTLVRAYPISIEWPSRWAESAPAAAACRRSVLEEHGLPPETLLGVGVDRIDYTKGVEERLLAVERLLESRPDYVGRFTFVQLGAPSRTKIAKYRDLNDDIERVVMRINARFSGPDGWRAVIFHRAHHEPPTVFRYYRAADLCYVSSLDDGMNLVAKEFVAARDDERGVLLLSRFTGAARELTESLIVNPYDFEEVSVALATALEMSADEQAERMRAMRSLVAEYNVYRWAGRMLVDASRLRSRDRLSLRLSAVSDTEEPRARRGPLRVLPR